MSNSAPVLLLVWLVPSWSPTGEAVTVEGVTLSFIPGAWVPEALWRFIGRLWQRGRPEPRR